MNPELGKPLRLDAAERSERKDFLQLAQKDEQRITALRELFERTAAETVDAFYEHLLRFEEAAAFFPSKELLERVKAAQADYFIRLAGGDYDEEYFDGRLRIGQIHHRISLHPKWYLGMYSFYFQRVSRLIAQQYRDRPDEAREAFLSLAKLIFMDIALAIEAYVAARMKAKEEVIEQQKLLVEELSRAELESRLETEHRHLEEEARIRRAYADVMAAVTGGKFVLLANEELKSRLLPLPISDIRLENPEDVRKARMTLADISRKLEFDPEKAHGLLVSVSEAATNAIVHGGGGYLRLRRNGDSIQAVICDEGPGIDFSLLPRAALMSGFSTKFSLGAGFTFMLEFCDQILISTSPSGTTIALESRKQPTNGSKERAPFLEDLLLAS